MSVCIILQFVSFFLYNRFPVSCGNIFRQHYPHVQLRKLNLNIFQADFGHYGCFAVNEVGRDYARIVVREEGGGAAAALVTGVAAAVLLAALLLVIAVVVVRRRHCACAQEAEGGGDEEKAPMYGLKECSVRLKRLDV